MCFSNYTFILWYLMIFDFLIDAEVSSYYVDSPREGRHESKCGDLIENICKYLCVGLPTLCEDGICYCGYGINQFQAMTTPTPKSAEKGVIIIEEEENVNDQPFLRHHIAHFCENLDKAAKCIKRCMKIGKPAFCGKDHVCYCGHKYTSHDKDKATDPFDTYAQYRDLYEKYFGKNG